MTCYKHVIPDLSSINKDITCDINYETDNNGCEILRIKCKSNDTTCESSYGCINGGNVNYYTSFPLPTIIEKPTEKRSTTVMSTYQCPEYTELPAFTLNNDDEVYDNDYKSIDHKEIDEKTTENDNGSSDEKVEGGEEENSKTKVISKSGEHNIEIDETLTENLMMKEKEKKIPKLRQFLIQMNK
ncbi:hypothetical protein H8356DRAFT_1047902 [Neocallimastix lanati (nom. inval.)]|uniref:Uncharacterized protein n=1 Tax=Neocallimastix californiae TaxID=1754190 RepID=A0A1Y2BZ35_9FUNG|nr:hypothetical protein H8356DRAFT_1047902 [Neocallimastix sp. JGI-2020a]ORY40020.1 hypothetical protein LY90DRAFT_622900 [Neocallimastix californiae]|eukprot:ORY40020.1 hypothetical protein LY90DRAFT_622900 [Neocallimastix californiae]